MVQNSVKYLLECSQVIKELLPTLEHNIVELKSKTVQSLAITYTT